MPWTLSACVREFRYDFGVVHEVSQQLGRDQSEPVATYCSTCEISTQRPLKCRPRLQRRLSMAVQLLTSNRTAAHCSYAVTNQKLTRVISVCWRRCQEHHRSLKSAGPRQVVTAA